MGLGTLAALPLLLLWQPLRQVIETRMLLHMLLEFPALLAAGWALQRLLQRAAAVQPLLRSLVLLDWRGWSGATLVTLVVAAWMVPTLLDMALLSGAVAAAKVLSWGLAGALLAGSLRRADPELRLFVVGNLAWMMASAGMLYIDAPARLCVNYLQDDQRQTGTALVLVALVLGVLLLRQMMRPAQLVAGSTGSGDLRGGHGSGL